MLAYQISMILRKPQISPENRKGKHEFSQVMQVFRIGIFQVTIVFKKHYKQCDQRNPATNVLAKVYQLYMVLYQCASILISHSQGIEDINCQCKYNNE